MTFWTPYSNLDYTTVVTSGNSRSDTGNGYRISNQIWAPPRLFNHSTVYADDLLWNQIFTQQFLDHAAFQDFSYGCATNDNNLVEETMNCNPNILDNYSIRNSVKSPGVRPQIPEYINSAINKTIEFDGILYVIWVGVNNYNFNKSLTPLQTVQSIIDCLNVLILFSARNLVDINEPPFDRFPHFRNETSTNSTKYLYLKHNELLAAEINESYLLLHTRLDIWLFDSNTFISKVLDNYTAYGFENLNNCWDTESNFSVVMKCVNTTKRIFLNEDHLTSAMHMLIAKELYSILGESNSTSAETMISANLNLFFIVVSTIGFFK